MGKDSGNRQGAVTRVPVFQRSAGMRSHHEVMIDKGLGLSQQASYPEEG